ncbi:hypothetical protein OPQ81_010582 [Rhizoctonia solani]|nr:hypothetical protein OPQ81_010582 [Rhizoctonia solani]
MSKKCQVVRDEETGDGAVGSIINGTSNTKSSPVQSSFDNRGNRGFTPRPFRLGSTHGSAHFGIHTRPLSLKSALGIKLAQNAFEEMKRKCNRTGSATMVEWLAQLGAGSNPYVDRKVVENAMEVLQGTACIFPPLTPTTPSLVSTSSSTSLTSTPTIPRSFSPPERPLTELFDILSAFPLPSSTVQWKTIPVSLPGSLETIVEGVRGARGDCPLRARWSYNGGEFDIVVAPTIPHELFTQEIGVAC